ncbi:MAG: YdcF family protein [Thermoleophilia bacterium]
MRSVRVALFAAAVVALAASTAVLFVFPPEDHPRRADVVVVLSGSHDRLPKGLELMRRGVAPVLVISDGAVPSWPVANRLCRGGKKFRVICFHPAPYSTRGEARFVADLMKRRGWKRVVVVTSRYHVLRARMDFRRCVEGHVDGVGASTSLGRWIAGVLQEWPKLGYALTVGRGC